MYAPTPNPYHVVAVVVDLLLEADCVKDVQASVVEQTPAEHTDMLRGSRMMFEFNASEYEHLEQFIREVRWRSGIERDEGLAGPDDVGEAARDHVERLVAAPGDAWDHHRIQITIREKCDYL